MVGAPVAGVGLTTPVMVMRIALPPLAMTQVLLLLYHWNTLAIEKPVREVESWASLLVAATCNSVGDGGALNTNM